MLTQAFPDAYDTVPSQGGGGVTGKQRSHKPESIKTAQRPTLQTDKGVPATDKRGLFSRPDSMGVKGETDGAPRRRRCDMSKPEVAAHVTPRFYMFAYPFFTAAGTRRGLQFAG